MKPKIHSRQGGEYLVRVPEEMRIVEGAPSEKLTGYVVVGLYKTVQRTNEWAKVSEKLDDYYSGNLAILSKIRSIVKPQRNALANVALNRLFISYRHSYEGEELPQWFEEKKQENIALPSWFVPYIKPSNPEPDIHTLANFMNEIEKTMKDGKGDELTDIFLKLDVKDIYPVILVTMLRISFPFRKSLTGWTEFLSRVEEELKRVRMDSDRRLRGLK